MEHGRLHGPLQRSIPIQQIPSGPVLSDPELPVAEADPPQDGRLLRRVAAYAVSRGASEGLLAVRGVLLATLLGPAAFGSWALLRLSTRYASLAGLSIFRGFEGGDYAYQMANAVIFFLISIVIAIIQLRFTRGKGGIAA